MAQSVAEDTVTECHNQKNCQDVSQSKEQRESTAIRGISGKCQNQKFYQGVLQSCVLISRECYN